MLTVDADVARTEERLAGGELACPDCDDRLEPWGWARSRVLRSRAGPVTVRPRRARCAGCGVSHVLLPVFALVRRADMAEVIGAALTRKAMGAGARPIAVELGRPWETVRGWLRRFDRRAGEIRSRFTALLVGLDPDPVPPAEAATPFADAVAAVIATVRAAATRWPDIGEVSPWWLACAVTGGRLLAPPIP
ncbi:hypothetical protein ACFYW6_39655 [Streptomyces sp. NPDC002659]|uniref:hypothetical protein n=1 Tax=Streptomyces sp. NPDC002659 TaxID=3364656 RepID=UPI0036AF7D5D